LSHLPARDRLAFDGELIQITALNAGNGSSVKNDDYMVGPHRFWIHFWCGLVLGAGIGAGIGFGTFGGGWSAIVILVSVALVVAYSCGHWGDTAWQWIIEMLGNLL